MAKKKELSNELIGKALRGSAYEVSFEQGDPLINFSIDAAQLNKLPVVNGFVQFSMRKRKKVSERGATHFVKHDDYMYKNANKA